MSDLISRTGAITIPVLPKEHREYQTQNIDDAFDYGWDEALKCVGMLPSAEPEPYEITDEQAILHLQSTGWMQSHDKQMYEMGLKEKLADDSDAYDSLTPSAQPEEVIPHRNYKYLSDYWCECGWHLGKKYEVKYCSDCGRKVNWDG